MGQHRRRRRIHSLRPFLWLCVVALGLAGSAVRAAAPEAIRTGAIGDDHLYDLFILPDGRVLRVLAHHIELTDIGMVDVTARFAHRGDRMGSVTLSADGLSLAIVSSRREVERWDIASRTRMSHWISPEQLYPAALSPDLSIMAVRDAGDVVLVDPGDGAEFGRFAWFAERGWELLAFSHDNTKLLATHTKRLDRNGGNDIYERTTELWDLSRLRLLHTLEQPTRITRDTVAQLRRATFTDDGRWVFATDFDAVIQWDAISGEFVRSWDAGDVVHQLTMSPDGSLIYAGVGASGWPRDAHRVKAWDVQTGAQMHELGDDTLYLRGFAVTPDGGSAALRYTGGFTAVWDVGAAERVSFDGRYVTPGWGGLADDGRYFVALSPGYTVWDLRAGKIREVVFPSFHYRYAVTASSGVFTAVDQDPWIEIRDVRSGEVVRRVENRQGSTPFRFTDNGRRLAKLASGKIVIHDVLDPANDVTGNLSNLPRGMGGVREIAFSDRDRYMAVSTSGGWAHVWEAKERGFAFRHSRRQRVDDIRGIDFGPGLEAPSLLVAGASEITVWNIDGREPVVTRTIAGTAPMAFVDVGGGTGRFLLVNGESGLRVVDWERNVVVADAVTPGFFAANSDGSVVVTSVADGETAVWDIRPVLDAQAVSVDARGRQLRAWGDVKRTALLRSYPNPFNPEAWIPFTLAEEARARVQVYDATGSHVRTLDLGTLPAGDYSRPADAARWDGKNAAGERVASGVYTYRFEAGAYAGTGRLTLGK